MMFISLASMLYFVCFFLENIILITSITLLTILIHEIGHYVKLVKYTENEGIELRYIVPKFSFRLGYEEQYNGLSYKELININLHGILTGWLFLCLVIMFFPMRVYIPACFLYFLGTLNDCKRIIQYNKNLRIEKK